jgi:hypothetical protein
MRGPTWSPDSARQPKLAFSFSPTTRQRPGAGGAPYELYRTNPLEQITFDGFDHLDASWGPAVRGHLLYLRASASLVRTFEQGCPLFGCCWDVPRRRARGVASSC